MTEIETETETKARPRTVHMPSRNFFEKSSVDRLVAGWLLASTLQAECPLLGGGGWDKPNIYMGGTTLTIYVHGFHTLGDEDESNGMECFRALVRHFSPMVKELSDHRGMYLYAKYKFMEMDFTLEIYPPDGVCTQRDTGKTETKIVKQTVRKATVKDVEVEVPVMEWVCPPVFGTASEDGTSD